MPRRDLIPSPSRERVRVNRRGSPYIPCLNNTNRSSSRNPTDYPVRHRPRVVLLDQRADHLDPVPSEAGHRLIQQRASDALPPVALRDRESGDGASPSVESAHDRPDHLSRPPPPRGIRVPGSDTARSTSSGVSVGVFEAPGRRPQPQHLRHVLSTAISDDRSCYQHNALHAILSRHRRLHRLARLQERILERDPLKHDYAMALR